jgi:biotin carboxylase
MSGAGTIVFVESNTSGTGRLFVQAARGMGYRPVLVTARPEKYAFLSQPGAPEVVRVPRADEETVLAAVRGLDAGRGVAGITSSSEYFIGTAAALAARMGLPGPDAGRIRQARDKSRQRELLAAAGVPVPAFRVVRGADEAAAAAREIGFPAVVKPVAGSGSVGVRACADAAQARAHAAAVLASPDAGDGRLLVESLVPGDEYSVEVFSGRVVGITRKHLGRLPHFVEAGHDYPAAAPGAVARALEETVVLGTRALGLEWGPLHWEVRVHQGRAVPIEVNPRLAGGFIPELVRHAQGVDLVLQTLRLVAGQAPELEPRHTRNASIRFLFAPGAGRLAAVEGVEAARARDGVVDVSLYRSPGDELAVHGDFRDRIGHVMACADGFDAACRAAERARDEVRVRVAPVEALVAEAVA